MSANFSWRRKQSRPSSSQSFENNKNFATLGKLFSIYWVMSCMNNNEHQRTETAMFVASIMVMDANYSPTISNNPRKGLWMSLSKRLARCPLWMILS